ncbi:MAG TPA: protein kinase [Trebonia sp.]|nr:protein kinase [Trebonia sp.]
MQPLSATDPRSAGEFTLRARLGSGGMGRVYLGHSPAGRAVAVKVVHPELARDEEFLARFRNEVIAARAVSGLYTAPVVASGLSDDPPWLATVYVPGPPLDDVVASHGPLPEPAVWRLAAGLAEALQAVHDSGVVHRDLKPSNVLLAADGPHVIDFGISRAMGGTHLTATGMVVGTPGYMSPEQAEGQEAGTASDVFSLACVVAFAATGKQPFGTGSAASVLYRVVAGQPDLDGIPARLREVLEACLRKIPAQRPLLPTVASAFSHGPGMADDSASPTSFWPPAIESIIRTATEGASGTASVSATGSPLNPPQGTQSPVPQSPVPQSPVPQSPAPSYRQPAYPSSYQPPSYMQTPPPGQPASGEQGRPTPPRQWPPVPGTPWPASGVQGMQGTQAPPVQAPRAPSPQPGYPSAPYQSSVQQPPVAQPAGRPSAPWPGPQPSGSSGAVPSGAVPHWSGPPAGQPGPAGPYGYRAAGRKPAWAELPSAVASGLRVMYTALGATVVAIVVSIVDMVRLNHLSVINQATSPGLSNQETTTLGFIVLFTFIPYLAGLVMWPVCALAVRKGRQWGTVVGTVMFGLDVIPLVLTLTLATGAPLTKLFTVIIWALGLVTIIMLWSTRARAFYRAFR